MSALDDALSLFGLPFAVAVAFVLIHAYFGVHVLRRGIVFADLALAQLSALGATVAFANGHAPTSAAGFGYALAFTVIGAALLTLIRVLSRVVSQEALIGILYVASTAATVLVVDRSPQGAEHVKKILVGNLLSVGWTDLVKFIALYAAIGLVHWLLRRPLSAVSSEALPTGRSTLGVSLWDFVFFLSFGIVVASSVTTAGVLLVFSFLIVPAVIGTLFAREVFVALAIGWAVGIGASALGLAGSYVLDSPTGATTVAAFVLCLVIAGILKALALGDPSRRRARLRVAGRALIATALVSILISSLWWIFNPEADQPLAAAFEKLSGFRPEHALGQVERDVYESAARDMVRFQGEVDRLNARERRARYEGAPLSDDEIRRIASYLQSFNEMTRGERFVQDVLKAKARRRERWFVALPAASASTAGLALILLPRWRRHGAPRYAAPSAAVGPASGSDVGS
jgi:zinc/manganese transport system permease protein